MAYKREEVNGTSPLDIKKINDNVRNIWNKVFGDINFSDADNDLKKKILTQWIPVQGEGNFDVNHPMIIRFFVPNNTKKIVSTNFNLFCERYRMDSGVAEGGGGVQDVAITMSMGSATVGVATVGGGGSTSSNGGGLSAYVSMWGNWNPDDPEGEGYDKVSVPAPYRFLKEVATNDTSIATEITDNSPYGLKYGTSGQTYRLAPAYRGSYNGNYQFWVDLATLQHKHVIPSHQHSVPSHGHDITMQSHTHSTTGKVSLQPHEHSLKEGIKISTNDAMGVGININGTAFAYMNSVDTSTINNLDIAQHIKIGQWNIIECSTVNLARVTLYGTIEIQIQP